MKWKGRPLALDFCVVGAGHTPRIRTRAGTLESDEEARSPNVGDWEIAVAGSS